MLCVCAEFYDEMINDFIGSENEKYIVNGSLGSPSELLYHWHRHQTQLQISYRS